MSQDFSSSAATGLRPAIYLGAAVTGLLLFVPFAKTILLPAYLGGPLVAVWFQQRRRGDPLSLNLSARLGFYSAFMGSLAAIALSRMIAQFFAEELWRWENLYKLPPLLAGKGLTFSGPGDWYLLLFQATVVAILSGALAAPAGVGAAKLLQRRKQG